MLICKRYYIMHKYNCIYKKKKKQSPTLDGEVLIHTIFQSSGSDCSECNSIMYVQM